MVGRCACGGGRRRIGSLQVARCHRPDARPAGGRRGGPARPHRLPDVAARLGTRTGPPRGADGARRPTERRPGAGVGGPALAAAVPRPAVHRPGGGAGPAAGRARRLPRRPAEAPEGALTSADAREPGARSPRYWRATVLRTWLSLSSISSPETSTVTLCRVPVNRNGDRYSGLTGEPGLAPQVSAPGLIMKGVVTGVSAPATSCPST